MQKIQITLTPEEMATLAWKARGLGYSVTKFVKFLVAKEAYAQTEEIPSYELNQELERLSLRAVDEYKKGKTKRIDSVEGLDNL